MKNVKTIDWKSYLLNELHEDSKHLWLMKVLYFPGEKLEFLMYNQDLKIFKKFVITYELVTQSLIDLSVVSDCKQVSEILAQIYTYVDCGGVPTNDAFKVEFFYISKDEIQDGLEKFDVKIRLEYDLDLTLSLHGADLDDPVLMYEDLLAASGRYLRQSQLVLGELVELLHDKVDALHECKDALSEIGGTYFLQEIMRKRPGVFDDFRYQSWVGGVLADLSQKTDVTKAEGQKQSILELDPYSLSKSPQKNAKVSPLKKYKHTQNSSEEEGLSSFNSRSNSLSTPQSDFVTKPLDRAKRNLQLHFESADGNSDEDNDFLPTGSPIRKKRVSRRKS